MSIGLGCRTRRPLWRCPGWSCAGSGQVLHRIGRPDCPDCRASWSTSDRTAGLGEATIATRIVPSYRFARGRELCALVSSKGCTVLSIMMRAAGRRGGWLARHRCGILASVASGLLPLIAGCGHSITAPSHGPTIAAFSTSNGAPGASATPRGRKTSTCPDAHVVGAVLGANVDGSPSVGGIGRLSSDSSGIVCTYSAASSSIEITIADGVSSAYLRSQEEILAAQKAAGVGLTLTSASGIGSSAFTYSLRAGALLVSGIAAMRDTHYVGISSTGNVAITRLESLARAVIGA